MPGTVFTRLASQRANLDRSGANPNPDRGAQWLQDTGADGLSIFPSGGEGIGAKSAKDLRI